MSARIDDSADISSRARVGDESTVWHLAQIREDAVVGIGCVVGRGAYIGSGVSVGDYCKIQNYALIYEPAHLDDGVFVGPAAVLTNDLYPRAINPDGTAKDGDDWVQVGVTVERGASIGARAVCVAPVTLGSWCSVAAGAVVTRNVGAYSLVAGIPARHIGWVGVAGAPLEEVSEGVWRCPQTGDQYLESNGVLIKESD